MKNLQKLYIPKGEPFCNLRSNTENAFDKKPKVNLKDKLYLETYCHHTPCQVQVDETPTKIRIQEPHIVG